jgi:hypothetical protein
VDAYTNHISSEPSGLTYVYKYIVPGGQSLIPGYISTAYSYGKKPVLVVYTNYDSTTPDWATWDAAMNAIRQDGRDVDVVVEPDLFGYIRNQNGCGTTGKQMVDRFLSTAPPNAHLGFFISPWSLPYTTAAADAASWKTCWLAAGGDRMEDIYVDVTDRDQEYKGTYPWPASQIQMYEDWFKALSQATGRKIGVWQIPLGNSQCANGRRSTFVENWLVQSKLLELAPYVDKLLFGPGIEDYDAANTQSWNLPQHVKYECGMFNSMVTSLSSGSASTPTVAPTATRTVAPTATRTAVPTATHTVAPTATATPAATRTVVPTATRTVAPTATRTVAPTATATPTATRTVVPTATRTVAPTATHTVVPTATRTVAPTATRTVVPTATRTVAPTATHTVVPAATATPTATRTVAPTATRTVTPTPTRTPGATITPTPVSVGLRTEAEWATLPYGYGRVYADRTASNGRALLIWSNASASRTVSLSGATTSLTVWAKGDQCNGAPHMIVYIDGIRRVSTAVPATRWTAFTARVGLAAGSHVVRVTFDNDYYGSCDRNLRVDAIDLR